MASLRPWVVAALASCVALALAYVPPRGAQSTREQPVFFFQTPRGTPARQRAQALADEWRGVEQSLRLVSARRQLRDVVHAASNRGNSLVVVSDTGGGTSRGDSSDSVRRKSASRWSSGGRVSHRHVTGRRWTRGSPAICHQIRRIGRPALRS